MICLIKWGEPVEQDMRRAPNEELDNLLEKHLL